MIWCSGWMQPGEIVPGIVESVVCSVLNDLTRQVTLPVIAVKRFQKQTKLQDLWWPLGIHLVFTTDSLLVCVCGLNLGGEFEVAALEIPMSDSEPPSIGEVVWELWKELRDVPDEVVEQNYQKLLKIVRANYAT